MATAVHNVIGTFGTDGDWSNAANWGGDTGVEPVSGDETLLRSSSQNLTTGLDNNLVNLDRLTVASTFTGSIGASGNTLRIDCTGTPGEVHYAGTGAEAWFTGDCDVFVAKSAAFGANSCVIDDGGAAVTTLIVQNGRPTVAGTCTVTTLDMVAAVNSSSRCVINSGATLTTLNVGGGTLENNSADTVTTLNQWGGTYEHAADSATVTTVNLYGGRYIFKGDSIITTLNIFGGVLDMTQTDKDKLITTVNGHGGVLDLRTNGAVTITNWNIYNGGALQIRGGQTGIG